MLETHIIEDLKKIVGADNVATDPQDLLCYSYDATQMEFRPDAVVYPADAQEVSAILKLANEERFAAFPRGRSMAGVIIRWVWRTRRSSPKLNWTRFFRKTKYC